MRKLLPLAVFSIVVLFVWLILKPDPIKQFNKASIRICADGILDSSECKNLKEVITTNHEIFKSEYPRFFPSSTFDEKSLHTFLTDQTRSGGKALKIACQAERAEVNIYIDNSISMDGYINGNTEFKDGVTYLFGKIPFFYGIQSIRVFMINKKAYPADNVYNIGVGVFIASLGPSSVNWKVGSEADRNSTVLNDLIKKILDSLSENQLCLFITDGIYAIPGANGRGINNMLAIQKNLTMYNFLNKIKTGMPLKAAILHYESDYSGKYYASNQSEFPIAQKRPYYIIAMGSPATVEGFLTDIDYTNAKGYRNRLIFSSQNSSQPSFSVRPGSNYRIDNDYTAGKIRKGIRGLDKTPAGQKEFIVEVDLSQDGNPPGAFLSKDNYECSSGFRIVNIEILGSDKITPTGFPATHAFRVEQTLPGTNIYCDVRVKPNLPDWVYRHNTLLDDTPATLGNKTFGLQYLIEGIQSAFITPTVQVRPPLFKIHIN